jgi:hypothetical protein
MGSGSSPWAFPPSKVIAASVGEGTSSEFNVDSCGVSLGSETVEVDEEPVKISVV